MSKVIKVASIQHACTENVSENLQTTERMIESAADAGSDLIVLSELHSLLYIGQENHPSYFDLAEPIPGPTTDQLQSWADTYNVLITGSVFEKRANGVYHNSAIVVDDDGSIAGIYRKMHIPDDPGFSEKYYFTPGDAQGGFVPIETSIGRLGVLVCWDQWFPEAARLMALAGAEILIYPTAIGWDNNDSPEEQQRQLDAWITIQRSHAIANHLPVIVANRCGYEPHPTSDSEEGIEFWGNSFICGQQGEILAQAGADSASTLVAEIDLERTDTLRRIWPFLRDRRIDAYQDLNKRCIEPSL